MKTCAFCKNINLRRSAYCTQDCSNQSKRGKYKKKTKIIMDKGNCEKCDGEFEFRKRYSRPNPRYCPECRRIVYKGMSL
jgi:RNA polymerase-binding transcription factor DksA